VFHQNPMSSSAGGRTNGTRGMSERGRGASYWKRMKMNSSFPREEERLQEVAVVT
jgi:hypothetical protein